MGVASGFSWGSGVIGWAAADLQRMVTEVGVAFSCWLLSVTVKSIVDKAATAATAATVPTPLIVALNLIKA